MNRAHEEKTVLVTGATQGIGKEIARGLAHLGARVLITARDAEKGATVADELKADSGNARVEVALVDFSSFASVWRFLDDVSARVERLDVLVNNAGAMFSEARDTEDGYERTFQVNHLGYFMTTLGLFGKLTAAGAARVVCVSSDAHFGGSINFARLGHTKGWFGFRPYAESKLLNLLFVREAARRFPAEITINAAHPGMVASGFGLDGGAVTAWYTLFRPLLKSPAQGADTPLWLATSEDVEGQSGRYFSRRKEWPSLPASRDAEVARRVWEESERMTGLSLPT